MDSQPPGGPELTIAALERWTLFGATWRMVRSDDEHVVIDLCACTGETVERRVCRDPVVMDYLLGAWKQGF